MRKWGLAVALALVIIAVGAWFDWTYHAIQTEVAEIGQRLPSEEELNGMTPDELSGIKLNLAMGCGRVAELKANPIARLVRGARIKELSDRCDLIKARLAALEGP